MGTTKNYGREKYEEPILPVVPQLCKIIYGGAFFFWIFFCVFTKDILLTTSCLQQILTFETTIFFCDFVHLFIYFVQFLFFQRADKNLGFFFFFLLNWIVICICIFISQSNQVENNCKYKFREKTGGFRMKKWLLESSKQDNIYEIFNIRKEI